MRGAVLLLVAGVAGAQPADFRQAAWGMTQAQVAATESTQPRSVSEVNGETVVGYDGIGFAGLAGRAVYIFAKDRLVRARYLLEAEHRELNDYIGDYKTVEPLLKEKYGKPASERAIWEDDSTQLEPKSYLDQDRATPANILTSDALVGLAVSLGHLRLLTEWAGARTKVFHALTGENRRITHQIEYRSVELEKLDAAARSDK